MRDEKKAVRTAEQMRRDIGVAIANSKALDGDCRNCKVRRITPLADADAEMLNRNWDVDMVTSECLGECATVVADLLKMLGERYDVAWPRRDAPQILPNSELAYYKGWDIEVTETDYVLRDGSGHVIRSGVTILGDVKNRALIQWQHAVAAIDQRVGVP